MNIDVIDVIIPLITAIIGFSMRAFLDRRLHMSRSFFNKQMEIHTDLYARFAKLQRMTITHVQAGDKNNMREFLEYWWDTEDYFRENEVFITDKDIRKEIIIFFDSLSKLKRSAGLSEHSRDWKKVEKALADIHNISGTKIPALLKSIRNKMERMLNPWVP